MNALIGNRDTDALEQSSTQYETEYVWSEKQIES